MEVTELQQSDTPLLKNLLNLYLHDMSQWFKFDPGANGLFDYDLDQFWSPGNHAFIAKNDDSPVGIALVETVNDRYDLKEFFILRRCRRTGAGRQFSAMLWDRLRGNWQVRVFAGNKPAMPFWQDVVADYSNGQYTEEHPEIAGNSWVHYGFRND